MKMNHFSLLSGLPELAKNIHFSMKLKGWPAAASVACVSGAFVGIAAIKAKQPKAEKSQTEEATAPKVQIVIPGVSEKEADEQSASFCYNTAA